jgi:hypothetical protein
MSARLKCIIHMFNTFLSLREEIVIYRNVSRHVTGVCNVVCDMYCCTCFVMQGCTGPASIYP